MTHNALFKSPAKIASDELTAMIEAGDLPHAAIATYAAAREAFDNRGDNSAEYAEYFWRNIRSAIYAAQDGNTFWLHDVYAEQVQRGLLSLRMFHEMERAFDACIETNAGIA